jgi:lysophospholipase L1-like esterase
MSSVLERLRRPAPVRPIVPDPGPDPLARAPWRRFAALGDSVAEGIGDPVDGYPHRGWLDSVADGLDRARPGLEYRNLGARGLLAEEVRETQLDAALAWRPDLVVLAAGGNDLFGPAFDGPGVEDELDAMVAALRRAGADDVTVGLFDISRSSLVSERFRSLFGERLRELSARTAAVAARHGAWHLDYGGHPASADDAIYSADGIHLNARGHAVAAAEALLELRRRAADGAVAAA